MSKNISSHGIPPWYSCTNRWCTCEALASASPAGMSSGVASYSWMSTMDDRDGSTCSESTVPSGRPMEIVPFSACAAWEYWNERDG